MRLAAVLLVSALIAGPASAQQPDFSKVEIRTEVLAPGVAVLFGQGGNIGVSHGPDGTVLIDDQFAPLTSKITAAVAGLGATSSTPIGMVTIPAATKTSAKRARRFSPMNRSVCACSRAMRQRRPPLPLPCPW